MPAVFLEPRDAVAVENPMYKFGFGILVVICALLSYRFRETSPASAKAHDSDMDLTAQGGDDGDDKEIRNNSVVRDVEMMLFKKFKLNYLIVYALVMASDWLQGPYIYALYRDYNYTLDQIAILFVAGFLSSAVFGTVIGSIADKFGRKRMCIVFCIVYAVSCLTKLSPAFSMLLLGRVLGGIATSLLFSVFEAWMVSEHFSRGFKEPLLSDTFSWSTFLNGLVAICAGVFANILVGSWGHVSPFMAAIGFLVAAGLVVSSTWKENYGNEKPSSSSSSIMDAVRAIRADFNILAVGVMQCFFESAMYTFVFLWSPVLEKLADENETLPFGVIFAAFMVSIMIGSVIFRALLKDGWRHEDIGKLAFLVAAIALFVPVLTENSTIVFAAFNLFETCCGLYFPTIGTIRGKFIPEETRATVMNVFRIPLNLIVVVSLLKVATRAAAAGEGEARDLPGPGAH
ncbi:Molybdate-anion transporter [Quaeritorhiza haematococci]|nr:Molybdate-anion transporter [Quaeritorhiza haematococci]